MTLSDTARDLLSKAAKRQDQLAEPPARLPAAARNAVFRSLIKQGLLEELPAPTEATHLAWRRDDDGVNIAARITDAALRTLNLDPPASAASSEYQDADCVGVVRNESVAAGAGPQARAYSFEAAEVPKDTMGEGDAAGALPGDRVAVPKIALPLVHRAAALRAAAEALLAAWDEAASGGTNIVHALETPMACLREALANRPAPSARVAPGGTSRLPRDNTKQAQVLALLRRDEATGWAPHTIRGFLACLKHKGITVETLDRVRQVAAKQQGAKGSYSVYRVSRADAG